MILERNQKVAVEKNIMVDVDPQIAKIFQQSTSISRKLFNYISISLIHHI